jgi:peptide/nickel transport system permease protein
MNSVKKVFKSILIYSGDQFRLIWKDRLGKIGFIILTAMIIIAIFAPIISPHGPNEVLRHEDGSLKRMEPPSWENPFGTTTFGKDILSQTIWGTRLTLKIGALAAILCVLIGTNVGLIAGFYGGRIDNILMRLTDIAYALPFLPTAIVLVSILGTSEWIIILVIALLLWRTTARTIRSNVLSLKTRPFVEAARCAGASNFRLMYREILPNILPLVFLFTAFSICWAVIAEVSLSFLGFGDPSKISWGQIIFLAYAGQVMRIAWWWFIPPGIAITLFVASCFYIGHSYEKVTNPRLETY